MASKSLYIGLMLLLGRILGTNGERGNTVQEQVHDVTYTKLNWKLFSSKNHLIQAHFFSHAPEHIYTIAYATNKL